MDLRNFLKHYCVFFLLLSIVSFVTFYYLGRPTIGIDDANIFFTYAKNVAKGYGFVFTENGERVEGFTSLLWTLICSVFFRVSQHPEKMIMIFSLLLTTLTITLVYKEVLIEVKEYRLQALNKFFIFLFSGFIVAIAPGFVCWNVLSLMDNCIWTFLLIFITVLLLQNNRQGLSVREKTLLITLSFLLVLARPESMGWGLLFTLILAITDLRRHRKPWFGLLFFGFLCLFNLGLYFFRVHYFGFPLPNTYYAKVSSDRLYNLLEGGKYAFFFVIGFHPVVTVSLLALIIASFSWIKWTATPGRSQKLAQEYYHKGPFPGFVMVTVLVIMAIGLPVLTGGDHFGGFRFYQPVLLLALWAIPALLHLYSLSTARDKLMLFASLVTLFFFIAALDNMINLKTPANRQLAIEFSLAQEGRNIAKTLNSSLPVKPSVGMIAVGGFALEYYGKTIDLMGLNNTLMAHSSGDRKGFKNHAAFNKDVFYKLNAELLLPKQISYYKEAFTFYREVQDQSGFYNKAMKNIFNDSNFTRSYLPIVLTKNDKKIFCFAKKEVLTDLTKFSGLSVLVIK